MGACHYESIREWASIPLPFSILWIVYGSLLNQKLRGFGSIRFSGRWIFGCDQIAFAGEVRENSACVTLRSYSRRAIDVTICMCALLLSGSLPGDSETCIRTAKLRLYLVGIKFTVSFRKSGIQIGIQYSLQSFENTLTCGIGWCNCRCKDCSFAWIKLSRLLVQY